MIQSLKVKMNNVHLHPFHLVDLSPWPIITAFSALMLTSSAVLYLHYFKYGFNMLIFALILLGFSMGC